MNVDMEIIITVPTLKLRCDPICAEGHLQNFPIAGDTIGKHRLNHLLEHNFEVVTKRSALQKTIYLPENIWVSGEDLIRLSIHPGAIRLVDKHEKLLAWKGHEKWQNCLDMMLASKPNVRIQYPWHLLELSEILGEDIHTQNNGEFVSPLSEVRGEVTLGEGSNILAGVTIEGNVTIGKNTRVGPNCYIRGTTTIGDNCIIGNAVEVKNSIIGHNTSIAHLTYVGDSIIGSNVNLGPCNVLSNTNSDCSEHSVDFGNKMVATGTDKLGSFIGDGTRTAPNTVISPATLIPAFTTTESGEVLS